MGDGVLPFVLFLVCPSRAEGCCGGIMFHLSWSPIFLEGEGESLVYGVEEVLRALLFQISSIRAEGLLGGMLASFTFPGMPFHFEYALVLPSQPLAFPLLFPPRRPCTP